MQNGLLKRMAAVVMAVGLAGACAAQSLKSQIRVTTDPEGAMVTCDGMLQQAPPVTIADLDPGKHLLVVEKSGYVPVRRTLSLLPNQKSAIEVKLEPVQGLVLIRSTPEGADIEISGAHRGKAPVLVTDLPLGKYRIKASATGYLTRETDIQIENRTPQLVKVDLPSDSAKLVVSSTPAGATVTVNGISKGVTPCEVDRLPSGDCKLELTLTDYVPYRQDIKLQAGDENKVEAVLKAVPASLSIISTPAGARITVDDQLRGQSPVVLDTLEAGTHTIKTELAGYVPETRTSELAKGQTKVEEFQLLRNSGSLELVTDPSGVAVAIDGVATGATSAVDGNLPSPPFKLEVMDVGSHRLALTKKGFYSIDKVFAIETNKTTVLREVLRRKFTPNTAVRTKSAPGDVLVGVLSRRLPNGDVELETKMGIFKTIKGDDIFAVDPLTSDDK